MIPATGFLAPSVVPIEPVAVPAPEPIGGTYRDYAGTDPSVRVQPIVVLDVRSGAHVLGGNVGYGVGGATLRFDMELHEVFGVALADVLTLPAFGSPYNPQGEGPRPGSAFAGDTRPGSAFAGDVRPGTAWSDDG